MIDSRLLVAVPETVWHKQVARRIIPSKCLLKPALIVVTATRVGEEGGPESDLRMKIWSGFLDPRFEELITFGIELEPIHAFSPAEERILPIIHSLVEVATDHFSFKSAESGLERPGALKQKPPTEAEEEIRGRNGIDSGGTSSSATKREDRSCREADECQPETKSQAEEEGVPRSRSSSGAICSDCRSPCRTSRGAWWNPSRETEKAGRPGEESSEDQCWTARRHPTRRGGEEQEEEAEEAEGTGGSGAVEAALVQLTKIASHLTESKRRDPLESLLDGGGSGAAGSDGSGLPTSKRNAAALRALQKCLKENPKYLYQCLEANLQSDFLSRPVQPGEPLTPGTTARGWLAAKSRVLNYTNHVRWSWQAAGIWDALMAGKVEEARARAGLLVASADQSSIDVVNWLLANASLLESPPPYQLFSNHLPPLSPLRPEVAGHLHGTREGSRQLPGGEEKAGKGWGQEGRQGGRCCSKSQSQSEGERRQSRKRERKEPVRRGWKLEGGADAKPSYRGREDRETVKLDGRTLSDLLCMSFLLPLAVTNLRAKVSPRLTATDASSWGEAGVVASVPERIIEEIYRHTLKKSLWVRLLSPARALQRQKNLLQPEDEIPNPEDRSHSHPLWQSLAEGLEFRVLFSKSKTSSRHINVGELRAMLRSEHLHALGEPESREVYALDSQVALGCLLKGRSSSSALNEELVGSLPVMLLQDKYSEGIYFETSVNPGDDPTRGKEVRKPTKSLPWWWEELKNGCYAGFDDWMRKHDIHPDETCGLPEFAELLHGKLLEEETQREESGLFEERFRGEEELRCFTDVFQRGGAEEQDITAEEQEPKKVNGSDFAEEDTEAETASSRGDDVSPCSFEEVKEAEDKSREETEVAEAEIREGGEKAEERKKEPEVRSPKKPKGELSARGVQLLKKIPESQFVGLNDPTFSDLRAGFLDLFSGERGVAEAIHRISGRWVLCYDLAHSAREDLDDTTIKEEVEELLREGCFHGAGGGPVCGSFSMAVTPPVRSREHPYGLPTASENMKPKIALGNRFARWMIKILEIGLSKGLCVWLENPASSWLFRLPIWKAFMRRHPEVGGWLLDYCRFHAKWRKRTLIVTNSLLKNFKTLCTGGHTHQLLRGRCKEKRKSWTAVAQAYPRGVALAIASGVLLHCGFAEWRGCFDPSACARAGHKRIGEAKNPGPRSVAHRQRGDLSQVNLVEAKTLGIQDKAWAGFLGWASELISPGAVRTAMAQPALLAELLREYGYHLYSNGKSLFVYRHLIVLVQQQIVGAKAYLGICWETISRWEMQEPVQHRIPLPFQIFLGMIGVGLCWNWRSFVAVLGISFYGISRPGEALAATRGDLILPSDRLEFDSSVAYVRVGAAKARRRGKHVVQHLTINDGSFVKFLEKYYGSWPPSAKLFQGSHSTFRRRWDAVLAALHIDKKVSLTPGGIRGGGCVFSFQSGVSIPMLMWKMRLKHQVTLESYLQEVVATTVLPRLSTKSRRRISAAAMIAPRLLNLWCASFWRPGDYQSCAPACTA